MSGTKKLKGAVAQTGRAELDKCDAQERQRAILLRNELIAGDIDIVARIMETGRSATFQRRSRIIRQGAPDDCVYFIVSGSVEVRINKRHIDFRSAPNSVGEMAAKKAGEVRTADVFVHSQTLEALVLSGTEFRKMMQDFPTFSRNLDDSIDALSRKKIVQLGELKKTGGLSWTAISGITGAALSIAAALVAWFAAASPLNIALVGLITGAVAFVCLLLTNPILRYRNLASAAGYALIALITYGSLSLMLTIEGKELQLPLIDFSVQTEIKLGALIVSCLALLALAWLGGHLDLRLGKSDEAQQ